MHVGITTLYFIYLFMLMWQPVVATFTSCWLWIWEISLSSRLQKLEQQMSFCRKNNRRSPVSRWVLEHLSPGDAGPPHRPTHTSWTTKTNNSPSVLPGKPQRWWCSLDTEVYVYLGREWASKWGGETETDRAGALILWAPHVCDKMQQGKIYFLPLLYFSWTRETQLRLRLRSHIWTLRDVREIISLFLQFTVMPCRWYSVCVCVFARVCVCVCVLRVITPTVVAEGDGREPQTVWRLSESKLHKNTQASLNKWNSSVPCPADTEGGGGFRRHVPRPWGQREICLLNLFLLFLSLRLQHEGKWHHHKAKSGLVTIIISFFLFFFFFFFLQFLVNMWGEQQL